MLLRSKKCGEKQNSDLIGGDFTCFNFVVTLVEITTYQTVILVLNRIF